MHSDERGGPLWTISGPFEVPGFLYGFRYPILVARMGVAPAGDEKWLSLVDSALSGLPSVDDRVAADRLQAGLPAVSAFLHWLHRIQQAAKVPVYDRGRVIATGEARADIAVPTPASFFPPTAAAMTWLEGLFAVLAAGRDPCGHLESLPDRLEAFEKHLSPAANVARFLRAAHAQGIPVKELPGATLQYGYGSQARWLQSAFTDRTSNIGVRLARNKIAAAAVLREARVPVPRHKRVQTEDDAVRAAEAIGYPVVVKPVDEDNSHGVTVGITTAEELRSAFRTAAGYSSDVMVEKHVEGGDHRLVVFRSELIWATHRVPGNVIGDGRSTVAELVERKSSPEGRAANYMAHPLAIDDEAMDTLRRAGLGLDSVPAEGSSVKLRRAFDYYRGGSAIPVLDRVHPDNRDLAIRAVEALQLDMAGVDMLIGDIGRSWRETGAVINEVNGSPNLGTSGLHIYGEFLVRLLGGKGRIPIAVVLGAHEKSPIAADIARHLAAGGRRIGRADASGVWIGASRVVEAAGAYADGQMLMLDRSVDAAVISVDDAATLRSGLPFDRFDVLVVAGAHVRAGLRTLDGSAATNNLGMLMKALLPMCSGTVMTVAEANFRLKPPLRGCAAEVRETPVPAGRIGRAVAEFVDASAAWPAPPKQQ